MSQVFYELVEGTWEGAHNLDRKLCNMNAIAGINVFRSPVGVSLDGVPAFSGLSSHERVYHTRSGDSSESAPNDREIQEKVAASD